MLCGLKMPVVNELSGLVNRSRRKKAKKIAPAAQVSCVNTARERQRESDSERATARGRQRERESESATARARQREREHINSILGYTKQQVLDLPMPAGHGRRCFQFAIWLTPRLIVRSERGGAEKKAALRQRAVPGAQSDRAGEHASAQRADREGSELRARARSE